MFHQFKDNGSPVMFGALCIAVVFFFFIMPWLLQASKRAIGTSVILGIGVIGKLIYSYVTASKPDA